MQGCNPSVALEAGAGGCGNMPSALEDCDNQGMERSAMDTEKNLHASIPHALLAEAEKIAAAQHVSLDEFTCTAMKNYMDELGVKEFYACDQQAKKLGIQEEDGDRIIHAFREDVKAGRVKPAREVYAARLSPEEWMREYRAWTHSHDGATVPILTNEDISRDSIYD